MTLLQYANKSTSAKKVTWRDAEEDVDKIYIEVKKKLLTTQVDNLHEVSHFNTTHLVL